MNERAQRVNDDTSIIGWVLAGLSTTVSVLCGIVAKFYHQQISDYQQAIAKLEKRADVCEEERAGLSVKCARLEERVDKIEKKVG